MQRPATISSSTGSQSEPSTRPTKGTRVVYVAGVSHSGSTLLGHILGEYEDSSYVGEIRNAWQRGVLENQVCTCGATFDHCRFWQAVIARLPFPASDRAKELSFLHRKAVHPSLAFPFTWTHLPAPDWTVFSAATEELYAAIAEIAGVHQLVDSSKSPLYARLLATLASIDLRIVHLVRDPRATVYSLLRRGDVGYLGAVERSLWWLRWNLAIERLTRLDIPYVRIRYEDLVENPEASLEHVTKSLGITSRPTPIRGHVVELRPKHIFSGNRARGEVGAITLREDSEWKSDLPPKMAMIIRSTTLPLLARYGYDDQ